jgi:Astacin (Peptidase family M12A)
MRTQYLAAVLVIVACVYFYFKKNAAPPVENPVAQGTREIVSPPSAPKPEAPLTQTQPPPQIKKPVPVAPAAQPPAKGRLKLHYVLEGNLAIVQGDVLVGAIVDDKAPEHGYVNIPDLRLWPNGVIPYFIQPTLTNPDRVRAAMDLFSETNIQFVPYANQENSIFFEDSPGVCKSYVGMVGGNQPIFLNPDCGPHEIAHEIMHALGFLHEQNRADRDNYIQVNFDNIDEKYKDNFEKLPSEYMKVSGLGSFDFESLMIYPPTMFALGNKLTMQPLDASKHIQPSQGLSKTDVARVNEAYH